MKSDCTERWDKVLSLFSLSGATGKMSSLVYLLLTTVSKSPPKVPWRIFHGLLAVSINSSQHFSHDGITGFCTFLQCLQMTNSSAETPATAYQKIQIHALHISRLALWCMCRVQPFHGCQTCNGHAKNLSHTYQMHCKCASHLCRACGVSLLLLRSISPMMYALNCAHTGFFCLDSTCRQQK